MADKLKSEFTEIGEVKEKTIPEYYLAKAKHFADLGRKVWVVDAITDEKRYFHKFEEETRKIASAFYKRGLRKGDTVIYMIKDLCKNYVLLTGVWRANGVMRASYPDDDANTILSRVVESKVKFIVCEEEAIDVLKEVSERSPWNVNIVTVNRNEKGLNSIQEFMEDDDGSECPKLDITEDDPAVILCTSGTTGMPKGAVHTHKSLLFMMRSLERIGFHLDKPNLVSTKATHISGTTFGLVLLGTGKTAVVVSKPTLEFIFNAVQKYKPGLVFAFPTFLVAMTGTEGQGYDFTSVETIFTGGVQVTPAIRSTLFKLPNLKDIIIAYGLTEVMMCTTNAILLDDEQRKEASYRDLPDFSVGRPYPQVILQIRDAETLEVLGPNQKGEICVKCPGLFQSYLNNPEATEKAFVDGFFRSGDIGYYDTEGLVYMVDRSKEIFKYYNDHISPSELENVIGKHPKVNEVCVVGVTDSGGHVPRAFVTIHGNCTGSKQEIAEEIKQYANAKLASYKQLRGGLFIVDDLPKGKTGKITRQLVEKLKVPTAY